MKSNKPSSVSATTSRSVPAPTHEQIKALAHAIWADRGGLEGRALDDWLEAERQLRGEPSTASASGASTTTTDRSDDTTLDPDNAPAARIDRELDRAVSPPDSRSATSL